MKKNIITIMTLVFAVTLLTGCPKDNGATNGYYSSGEEDVFRDDVTNGYNRDYQRKNQYQSSNSNASKNGYGSSNNAQSGSQGYQSPTPSEQAKSNGYRSNS